MKMKTLVSALVATAAIAVNADIAVAQCANNPATQSNSTFPSALTGKLVYHSYVSDGDGTSQLWVYDFTAHTLTQVSSGWSITDPMNAVWSPDGKWLLFMGIANNAWNIFAWPTDGSAAPYNLTHSTGATRNEDPKFSADGTKIIFKQNSANAYSAPFTVTSGVPSIGSLTNVTNNSAQDSMPFFEPDNSGVVFAEGTGSGLQVYYKNLGSGTTSLFAQHGYYPIVRADKTVFYSDTTSGFDQVNYKVNAGDTASVAKINDCQSNNSDAWPVDGSSYVFFSSTQPGNYQLHVGDLSTGKRWSLSPLGINSNTGRAYLGPAYYGGTSSGGGNGSGSSATVNLSQGQACSASSYSTIGGQALVCANAFDGNTSSTRWDSVEGSTADPSWIYVNLGSQCAVGPNGHCTVTGIDLYWDAGAKVYQMQSSPDGKNWTTFYSVTNGTSYTHTLIKNLNVPANYIRMYGTQRATQYGYSIKEMQVWGCTATTCN